MDGLFVAAISAGISIAVALVGAYVAQRKGLPQINAEIEDRMQQLVSTLRSELDAKVGQLEDCAKELKVTKSRVKELERLQADDKQLIDRLFRRLDRAGIDDRIDDDPPIRRTR